jgi:hypothetical protein
MVQEMKLHEVVVGKAVVVEMAMMGRIMMKTTKKMKKKTSWMTCCATRNKNYY